MVTGVKTHRHDPQLREENSTAHNYQITPPKAGRSRGIGNFTQRNNLFPTEMLSRNECSTGHGSAAKKTAPKGAVASIVPFPPSVTYAPPPTTSAVRCSSRSHPWVSRWPVSVSVRPAGRTSIARRVPGSFSGRRPVGPWSVRGGP